MGAGKCFYNAIRIFEGADDCIDIDAGLDATVGEAIEEVEEGTEFRIIAEALVEIREVFEGTWGGFGFDIDFFGEVETEKPRQSERVIGFEVGLERRVIEDREDGGALAGIRGVCGIAGKPGEVEEADFAEPGIDCATEGNLGGIVDAAACSIRGGDGLDAETAGCVSRRGMCAASGCDPR